MRIFLLTVAFNSTTSGLKYIKPPRLPINLVDRPKILKEMVDKICNANLNIDCYSTTLTITGAGGFGKTTIVTALCHHPTIKQQFTNGFVFVHLGPQSSDPIEKLCQLYHLLTGQDLKAGDTNHAEQEIQQLIETHYQNILVIIDDVWHVEDADPIVRAFGCCKTVLTTRMNDIEQYISTAEKINIGPMETDEAITLLTNGVTDSSTLLHEDINLLEELAQEAHLWPLLLSLIRGHLFHNVKKLKKSHRDAIHSIQMKLHEKGLTAFDKNNFGNKEKNKENRKFATKICIEITLDLLSQTQSNNFKSLILSTGVGNSLPRQVLHYLWNVSEMEAEGKVSTLWGYGLVTFVDTIIPPNNKLQPCVEVHAVISQFIIENIDSDQVFRLSPYGGLATANVLKHGLEVSFQQSYGICDITILYSKPAEYLKYTKSKVECDLLPYYLKKIDMRRIYELHYITSQINAIQDILQSSVSTQSVSEQFKEQTTPLKVECVKLLRHVHKLSRELKQVIQRHLMDGNYTTLTQAVENKCLNSPIGTLAQTTVAAIQGVISHCEPQQLSIITRYCEYLQRITPDYDIVRHKIVPYINLHIELHQKITSALQKGSPHVELTFQYCTAGKYEEEFDLIHTCYISRQQGIASSLVNYQIFYLPQKP